MWKYTFDYWKLKHAKKAHLNIVWQFACDTDIKECSMNTPSTCEKLIFALWIQLGKLMGVLSHNKTHFYIFERIVLYF
jgi:hypothetical protein